MAEKDYDDVMQLLAFFRFLKRLVWPSMFFLL